MGMEVQPVELEATVLVGDMGQVAMVAGTVLELLGATGLVPLAMELGEQPAGMEAGQGEEVLGPGARAMAVLLEGPTEARVEELKEATVQGRAMGELVPGVVAGLLLLLLVEQVPAGMGPAAGTATGPVMATVVRLGLAMAVARGRLDMVALLEQQGALLVMAALVLVGARLGAATLGTMTLLMAVAPGTRVIHKGSGRGSWLAGMRLCQAGGPSCSQHDQGLHVLYIRRCCPEHRSSSQDD